MVRQASVSPLSLYNLITPARLRYRLQTETIMKVAISSHRGELEPLCRRHRVQKLELFGSAVAGNEQAEANDLDFSCGVLFHGSGRLRQFLLRFARISSHMSYLSGLTMPGR
jgi:predicted nucleotidyltransferase